MSSNGNSGMSYDYSRIAEVSLILGDCITEFDNIIDSIYTSIQKMNNSWSGDTYNAFKAYCDNYKTTTIDPLSSEIKKWVIDLLEISGIAEETKKKNASLFEF